MKRSLALFALLLVSCASPKSAVVPEITVAAASDLRPAFEAIAKQFTADTGTKVAFTFGSSGQLSQQIINGAPVDLFASASIEYVDAVIKAGHGDATTKADYAFGRIVLWAAPGRPPPKTVAELATYTHIAIANPAHAPYGVAAKQALESAGIYDQVKDRTVLGENISDTAQIIHSGNADAGIISLSLALADGGPYTLISPDAYAPLEQALVVIGTGPNATAAKRFATAVTSKAGREIMAHFGFLLPNDTAPAA